VSAVAAWVWIIVLGLLTMALIVAADVSQERRWRRHEAAMLRCPDCEDRP